MLLPDNHYFIAGLEDIFPVIIVIVILVSKFIESTSGKNKKSKSSSANKPYSAPPAELKRFLETLTGTVIEPPDEPQAPPPPPIITPAPEPKQPDYHQINHPHIHHATRHKTKKTSWERKKIDREKEHPEIPYAPPQAHRKTHQQYGTVINKPHIVSMQETNFNWEHSNIKSKQKLVTPDMIGNALISRNSLAQAFVMKEILDTPLGLRVE